MHRGVDGRAHSRRRAPPRAAEASDAPLAARVLLVEDNCVNQEICAAMLDDLGCEVEVVDNGRAGVAAAFSRQYDVVLMDCQMPEMDGFEAARRYARARSRRRAQRPDCRRGACRSSR